MARLSAPGWNLVARVDGILGRVHGLRDVAEFMRQGTIERRDVGPDVRGC
ncbi:hypothetical protein [Streptomyces sp. NPDC006668]